MRNALVAHDSATSPSVVGALPMSDAMRKPLVVIALREEAAGLFESSSVDVLFTGVGKVNATYRLTKALAERRAHVLARVAHARLANDAIPERQLAVRTGTEPEADRVPLQVAHVSSRGIWMVFSLPSYDSSKSISGMRGRGVDMVG